MSAHSTRTSPTMKVLWRPYEPYARHDWVTPNQATYLWWKCSPKCWHTTTSSLMVKIIFKLEVPLWALESHHHDFEEKHVYIHHLQPATWYCYIDDIFCLWQHGEDELEKFTTHLNSVHETIKFTIEKSRISVSFLDTEVDLDNNHIYTTLYVKPTERNNYLPSTLLTRTIARKDYHMVSSYA